MCCRLPHRPEVAHNCCAETSRCLDSLAYRHGVRPPAHRPHRGRTQILHVGTQDLSVGSHRCLGLTEGARVSQRAPPAAAAAEQDRTRVGTLSVSRSHTTESVAHYRWARGRRHDGHLTKAEREELYSPRGHGRTRLRAVRFVRRHHRPVGVHQDAPPAAQGPTWTCSLQHFKNSGPNQTSGTTCNMQSTRSRSRRQWRPRKHRRCWPGLVWIASGYRVRWNSQTETSASRRFGTSALSGASANLCKGGDASSMVPTFTAGRTAILQCYIT